MTATPCTLEELNAMPRGAFVATLAGVFERSPWVADAAADARPFESVTVLHRTMTAIVERAEDARQLALIEAHPELAGKAAVRGELTAESAREQSGAGLSQCTPEEFDTLQRLNSAYRKKFGFPFILAVRGCDRARIIANFETRLANDRQQERRANLEQIYLIAQFRLDDLLGT